MVRLCTGMLRVQLRKSGKLSVSIDLGISRRGRVLGMKM